MSKLTVFKEFYLRLNNSSVRGRLFQLFFIALVLNGLFLINLKNTYSQVVQSGAFTVGQPQYNNNYLSNSSAFKQEIARMEINVIRQDKIPVSITQVPRLQKDDVLKIRLLDEQVNGTKIDQSNWNWTLSVAYINPGIKKDKESAVSEEIQFRKSGWYKEYTLVVPYDCQPIFFLYSKPNYRGKISNLVVNNYEEISKIGEKSIELSDAYAKIGSFLDELQFVVNRNSYGSFGNYGSYDTSGGYGNTSGYGNTYGAFSGGGGYGYGNNGANSTLNRNFFMNQSVERLARSFNIALPSCWQNSSNSFGNYGGAYGTNNTTPGTYYGVSQDFVSRSQCVARSVKLEDFDVSVSRMLQQGGILTATALSVKYPQLAFWINIAAAAIDTINKIRRKSPLRIVPTVMSTSDNQSLNNGYNGYQNNFTQPGYVAPGQDSRQNTVKISIYAASAPNDTDFVTAYPLVVQKWQASPDPEIISLPTPVLAETCLHPGQNILRSTDLKTDWLSDQFTRNFQLVMSSPNGFRKEFPLKKNVGQAGWELNLTREDLNAFPKIELTLDSVITGTRGFNELKSPKFDIPVPNGGKWEIDENSQKTFAVGGKRMLKVKNLIGNCKCLQSVVYKPSFGGQFVFEQPNLNYSPDGSSVSLEIDTENFQAGQGILELRQLGGEVVNLNINLYPAPPEITDLKISKGDTKAVVYGIGLDQIKAITVNGKRAILEGSNSNNVSTSANVSPQIYNGTQIGNAAYSAPIPSALSATAGERVFVFEDSNARQTSNNVSLELELSENRVYQYPKTFGVSASRPAIVSNESNEVEGIAVRETTILDKTVGRISKTDSQFILDLSPIYPITSSGISINLQNALTDYDFKIENIDIETKIENSQINAVDLPKPKFEVLDWKNLRVNFQLNEQVLRLLGGRRLQFRIKDKERGSSDWYTLKKTFARVPQLLSIKCPVNDSTGSCKLMGDGIDYISQVSVDGGKTWFPQAPATLVVVPTEDSKSIAVIPHYQGKKLLKLRLRDFPAQSLEFKSN